MAVMPGPGQQPSITLETKGAIFDERFQGEVYQKFWGNLVNQSLIDLRNAVVERTPMLVGDLRRAIYVQSEGDPVTRGFVSAPRPGMEFTNRYLKPIEYGQNPRQNIPYWSLHRWAVLRGKSNPRAFAAVVKRNMQRRGSIAYRMFGNAYVDMYPVIEDRFQRAADQIAKMGSANTLEMAQDMRAWPEELGGGEGMMVSITINFAKPIRDGGPSTVQPRGRGTTISKVRGQLYRAGRILGDISAVTGISFGGFRGALYGVSRQLGDISAVRRGRIGERVEARIAGRITGRVMGGTLPRAGGIGGRIVRRGGGRLSGRTLGRVRGR